MFSQVEAESREKLHFFESLSTRLNRNSQSLDLGYIVIFSPPVDGVNAIGLEKFRNGSGKVKWLVLKVLS